jgi:hypothetical protein
MGYLLDANVFIEAKRRHYGFDFCPAFWDWLDTQHAAGMVFSIEKVGDELLSGNDELSEWVGQRGARFFLPPDDRMLASLAAVADWVRGQRYRPGAIGAFLEDPDYYLVAYAHAHGHVVITHEVLCLDKRQLKGTRDTAEIQPWNLCSLDLPTASEELDLEDSDG